MEKLKKELEELLTQTQVEMSQRKEDDEYWTYLKGQKDLLEILIRHIKQ